MFVVTTETKQHPRYKETKTVIESPNHPGYRFIIKSFEIPGEAYPKPTSRSQHKPSFLKEHVEMWDSPSRFEAMWTPMYMEDEYALAIVDYFRRTHPAAKIMSVNHSQVRGGNLPLGLSILCLHYRTAE